jgi:hypothetical protein
MNHDEILNKVLKPGLGVALSGGGVRASLFSLGALLYLVDSNLNIHVSEIYPITPFDQLPKLPMT